jgi:hypothetical protein
MDWPIRTVGPYAVTADVGVRNRASLYSADTDFLLLTDLSKYHTNLS